MIETKKFQLNTEEAKKLNILLPRGYRLVTPEEFKKKAMLKPKKKTIMGLPVTQQIVNTSISLNLSQSLYQPATTNLTVPSTLPMSRSTKNTKFMGIPSYDSIPQSDFYVPLVSSKSYQKIPLNLDYYSQKKAQILSTPIVFSKLKNHPQIMQLDKVEPQQYSMSFKQIQKKVNTERDNYKVNQLVSDISKLCLKIYESYPRESNEYQNTVSIQKYLKSLTKVQKAETYIPPSQNIGLLRQPSVSSQIKKKPLVRLSDLNSVMTIKEKRQLGQRIKKLPSQNLQQICYIIFQNLQNKEYSFDLETLHIKKIRQLQDYVNSCLDYSQIKDNDDQNRLNDDDEGEESSFIIQGDEQDQNTNADLQF